MSKFEVRLVEYPYTNCLEIWVDGEMEQHYYDDIAEEDVLFTKDLSWVKEWIEKAYQLGLKDGSSIDTQDSCRCGVNELLPLHPCPYQAEINDNHDFRCTCCTYCIQECADDI